MRLGRHQRALTRASMMSQRAEPWACCAEQPTRLAQALRQAAQQRLQCMARIAAVHMVKQRLVRGAVPFAGTSTGRIESHRRGFNARRALLRRP